MTLMDSQPQSLAFSVDLRKYLQLLKHWAWLIVLVTIVFGVVSFWMSTRQPKVYRATATMLINENQGVSDDPYSNVRSEERLATTYSQMMVQQPTLEGVIQELGLEISPGVLKNSISVQVVPNTSLLRVSVEDTDPVRAADIVNTIGIVFAVQTDELQASRYAETKTNLVAQMESMDFQIHEATQALEELGEVTEEDIRRGLLETELTAYQEVYQSIKESLIVSELKPTVSADVEVVDSDDVFKQQLVYLQQRIRETNASILALGKTEGIEYDLLESRLNAYQNVYDNLLNNLVNTELETVTGASSNLFLEEGATTFQFTDASTLSNQLDAVDQRIREISRELDELGRATQVGAERDRIVSNLALYRQTYASLVQSFENVRLAEIQSSSSVVLVERATPPSRPIRPNITQNTLIAAVIGLMASVGIIFAIEMLDDTLKSPDEVSSHLGLPVLGMIFTHDTEKGPITLNSPRAPVAEAFRSLRTNIHYTSVDHSLETLLVTSPSAGVGKTTISSNLGVVLAQGGQKTILIDADLRRPMVHKIFNLPNRLGLSSSFVFSSLFKDDRAIPEGTLQSTKVEGLSVITSGKLPPNPSELLGSEKMQTILNDLREQADVLIIDAPPLLAVTDAAVLAARADRVVLVLQPGVTKLELARKSVEQLHHVGANLVGVILNNIEPSSGRYGYYTYYYDSQYYGADVAPSGKPLTGEKRGPLPSLERLRALWGLQRAWQWLLWAGLAALLLVVGSWYAFNLNTRQTIASLPTTTQAAAVQTQLASTLEGPRTTVTPTPLQQSVASNEENGVVEEILPSTTPTPTSTFPPPTPGPMLLTPFGSTEKYLLHKVTFGESLPILAAQYLTDRDVIVAANGLVPNQSLQPGQVIVIMPGRTDSFEIEPLRILFLDEDTSVSTLAQDYFVSSEEVRQYNEIGLNDYVPKGRWVILPQRELSLALTRPFGPNNEFVLHRVARGDNLYILEEHYQTSVDVIRAANDFQGSITEGQVLVILLGRIWPDGIEPFEVELVDDLYRVDDLANIYGVPLEDLLYYNDLEAGQLVSANTWLIYPRRGEPTPTVTPLPTPDLSEALTDPFGPNDNYVIHLVKSGDSLPTLSKAYLTSPEVINAANVIKGSIIEDSLLVIVVDETNPEGIEPFEVYYVEETTTVEDLSFELSVLAADLMYFNSFEAGQEIQAGSWVIYSVPIEE